MAKITGYTAERMQAIENNTLVSAAIVGDELVFTRYNDLQFSAGVVKGEKGDQGIVGPMPSFGGYKEPIDNKGNVAGSVTLDFGNYNVWRISPTAAVSILFANLPASSHVTPGTLIVASSAHAITWPSGTKFPNAVPPVLQGETWLSIVAHGSTVTVSSVWFSVAAAS